MCCDGLQLAAGTAPGTVGSGGGCGRDPLRWRSAGELLGLSGWSGGDVPDPVNEGLLLPVHPPASLHAAARANRRQPATLSPPGIGTPGSARQAAARSSVAWPPNLLDGAGMSRPTEDPSPGRPTRAGQVCRPLAPYGQGCGPRWTIWPPRRPSRCRCPVGHRASIRDAGSPAVT